MRRLAIVVAVVCVVVGCADLEEGTAVANPQPPQDVWHLAEQAASLVPLSLGPALQVASSVIGVGDDSWMFAAIEIEPTPCVSLDMVKARYPSLTLKSAPSGHSIYEEFLWATVYDWGDLAFGIREKEQCLTGISLERAGDEPIGWAGKHRGT
jgi:hypothetical protein